MLRLVQSCSLDIHSFVKGLANELFSPQTCGLLLHLIFPVIVCAERLPGVDWELQLGPVRV